MDFIVQWTTITLIVIIIINISAVTGPSICDTNKLLIRMVNLKLKCFSSFVLGQTLKK